MKNSKRVIKTLAATFVLFACSVCSVYSSEFDSKYKIVGIVPVTAASGPDSDPFKTFLIVTVSDQREVLFSEGSLERIGISAMAARDYTNLVIFTEGIDVATKWANIVKSNELNCVKHLLPKNNRDKEIAAFVEESQRLTKEVEKITNKENFTDEDAVKGLKLYKELQALEEKGAKIDKNINKNEGWVDSFVFASEKNGQECITLLTIAKPKYYNSKTNRSISLFIEMKNLSIFKEILNKVPNAYEELVSPKKINIIIKDDGGKKE